MKGEKRPITSRKKSREWRTKELYGVGMAGKNGEDGRGHGEWRGLKKERIKRCCMSNEKHERMRERSHERTLEKG